MIDVRLFPILNEDFDHVEAPWQISRTDTLEPLVGPALNEGLFFLGDSIEGPDSGVRLARFHLDEEQ